MECCVFCLPLDLWLNACNECTQQQQQQQQWRCWHWAALLITSRRAAVERLSSENATTELSIITTIINNIKWPQHHKYQLRVFYYLQLNRNAEAGSPIPYQIQFHFHFKLSPPSCPALLCSGLPACLLAAVIRFALLNCLRYSPAKWRVGFAGTRACLRPTSQEFIGSGVKSRTNNYVYV